MTPTHELHAIAHRLRNYAAAPRPDLRDIADRLDAIATTPPAGRDAPQPQTDEAQIADVLDLLTSDYMQRQGPERMAAAIVSRLAPQPSGDTLTDDEREAGGRLVREVWIEWAREQPNPKASWLVPWEGLAEPDREVDRRIAERLTLAARTQPSAPAQTAAQALREAADEMEAVISDGDVAEVAAHVPGEVGRASAVGKRDTLYEEPHTWLREYAAALAQDRETP